MTSSATVNTSDLLFVTTYDPGNQSSGGAAWVDSAILAALTDTSVEAFCVCEDSPDGVPLEIRGSRSAQVRTLFRIVSRCEPYQAAKFRFANGWKTRLDELRRAADQVRNSGGRVVTSQWPALLLARDAGVPVDIHIAHNVDTIIARRYDPPALKALRNADRMSRAEVDLLGHPASIFALSRTDAERIRAMGHRCEHLSLAPPLARKTTAVGGKPGSRAIGFIGKMTWPPNVSAFESLLSIVAKVNRRLEEKDRYSVVLAGRGSENFSSHGSVTALGQVSDIDDFYSKIDLVVVPRTGETTGVSIKLLEAVTKGVIAVAPGDLIADAGLRDGVLAANDDDAMYRLLLEEEIDSTLAEQADDAISLGAFAKIVGQAYRRTR